MSISKDQAAAQAVKTAETLEATLQTNKRTRWLDIAVIVWAVLAIVLVLATVWYFNPVGLQLQANLQTVIPSMLGSMLLISLLVERAVEVFMIVFRNPIASVHEQNLAHYRSRQRRLMDEIASLIAERNGSPAPDESRKAAIDAELKEDGPKRKDLTEAEKNADAEEKALLPFRSTTRRSSATLGLCFGMLAAAVGFRFLFQIVKLDGAPADQLLWFGCIDVLLTGAMVSGGSQAIHQIFTVYSQFMDSTQKSVAARATPI